MTRPILADYVLNGWALVNFNSGQKGPTAPGWQRRDHAITDPAVAAELGGNVGLLHAYSGTCALDIDDFELSRAWLGQRGIDLDDLWNAADAVRLSSGRPNRGKLIYLLDKPLPSKKIIIEKQSVIDFRCGNRVGTTVQDVLPPSIHPDTGRPYQWQYGNDAIGHWSTPPKLPDAVRAVWEGLVGEVAVIAHEPRAPSLGLGKARAMLFDNDPDCDRDRWVHIGMALHHESQGGMDGFELWNEWSARGQKYAGRADLETVWRSFHIDATNPITISTLRVDTAALDEEFEPVVIEPEPADRAVNTQRKGEIEESLRKIQRDKSGLALATLPNVTTVLSVPEASGRQIAFDGFSDQLVCAPYGTELWRPIKDTDYTATRIWLENMGRFNPVSKEMVRDSIYYLAEANTVDTAQKWLTGLVWDGTPRIRNFFPLYFNTIATEYEYTAGEYIWTALAGRVMKPGCQADMVPILIGAQGIGKSRGVRAMVPDPKLYASIKLGEDDDVLARLMRGVLIGEIDEMRGMQSDLDAVKSFITRTHEKWTPKYVEFATSYARRIMFIGTTNEEEVFRDTENRRWLPLRIAAVEVEAIERDRDQLWAEALTLWMENGIMWSRAEELARGQHKQYEVVDQWAEIVEQWIEDNQADNPVVRTHDVMIMALGLDSRTITRAQELRVSRLLANAGYERKLQRDAKGKVFRAWVKKGVDKRKRRS